MKFPFILRSDHEDQIRLLNIIIDSNLNTVVDLKFKLQQKKNEIDSLIQELFTQPPIAPKVVREKKPQQTPVGRSGWRVRAELRSKQTVPVPKDSAKALEERVAKEGGSV